MDLVLIRVGFILILSIAAYFFHPSRFQSLDRRVQRCRCCCAHDCFRAASARAEPQTAHWRGRGQHPRYLRSVPLQRRPAQQHSRRRNPGAAADPRPPVYVLRRSGRRRKQRCAPESRGARRPLQYEASAGTQKILDTSAIIDGRIADMADTGFLEGTLAVPSSCSTSCRWSPTLPMDRSASVAAAALISPAHAGQRPAHHRDHRRGLSQIKEVDLKLIELAKKLRAKIVTNDFNLNKVAHLHKVPVLNINDLANSLRPVVLPGEKMNIVILKEGKEYNQGVGYLDDGTMVVVDHARRLIGRAIEITVTSVSADRLGKMIFGRFEEGRTEEEPKTGAGASDQCRSTGDVRNLSRFSLDSAVVRVFHPCGTRDHRTDIRTSASGQVHMAHRHINAIRCRAKIDSRSLQTEVYRHLGGCAKDHDEDDREGQQFHHQLRDHQDSDPACAFPSPASQAHAGSERCRAAPPAESRR